MAAAALVAPKCLISQALAAAPAPGAFVLEGVRFTRVWLQARAQQVLMRVRADVAHALAAQGVLVAATPDCSEALLDAASGSRYAALCTIGRASRTWAIQSGPYLPWPMAIRQPMMLRIMWCKKALASNSKRQ